MFGTYLLLFGTIRLPNFESSSLTLAFQYGYYGFFVFLFGLSAIQVLKCIFTLEAIVQLASEKPR